jgi:hypothetical protein
MEKNNMDPHKTIKAGRNSNILRMQIYSIALWTG